MRTRIIPAQITTVEDKIAGSLNITQLLLLMTPVLFITTVFILLPPRVHFDIYKLVLSFVVIVLCAILAFRYKGKVIANWLVILIRYNLRAKWYVLNKNDKYQRTMYLPLYKNEKRVSKKASVQETKQQLKTVSLAGMAQLEKFITDPKFSFTIESKKKGGLNVALKQIQ